jgi:flagellar hook-associated protein 2
MSSIQNTNRLTGLFTGMDTDALVKAMMMTQQRRVNMYAARKTQAEWKREQITDFNNKLRIFRENYGSVLGSNTLLSRGTFSSFSVKMAENSGVSIAASASAKAGSYNIRVEQLASAASLQGGKLTSRSTGLTAAEIGSAPVGSLSGALASGESFSGGIEFSINGREFSFSSDATLRSIMDEVNNAGIGVTMAYTQMTDRVSITSGTQGAASELTFTDDSGFLAFLGMESVTAGRDAVVYINGEETARHLDTNSITLDGITMNFLRTTGETGVDFTLTSDIKPAVDRIRSMVDAYNALIKEIDTAYNQKSNRDFPPLTDEQRGELSDKEAEDWEAKAKEGLMHRDRELGRLLEGMRSALSGAFGGSGTLASIGITTGRYILGEPVQLQIDEEKLTEALQEDPDRVYNIFAASDTGLMVQLNKVMDGYVNTTRGREIQNLNNSINNYTKRVAEQESKLTIQSERLYLQYARLETMLGQMMSQQDQMASLFGWNNNN